MSTTSSPKVALIGAGPGDPELLTLKAIKALRGAPVALVDDLVGPGVLKFLRRSARVVQVGKRGGCVSTPQAFIHKLMIAEALRGERVVRVKGGDPFVFGRGGEECAALRGADIDVEVIGGLTAGITAPASIGVPVTDRRHARGVAFVTGHTGADSTAPNWAALARSGLTHVAAGIVASYARPGGNVTGVDMLLRLLDAKRLDILHQAVPRARKIAVLVYDMKANRCADGTRTWAAKPPSRLTPSARGATKVTMG